MLLIAYWQIARTNVTSGAIMVLDQDAAIACGHVIRSSSREQCHISASKLRPQAVSRPRDVLCCTLSSREGTENVSGCTALPCEIGNAFVAICGRYDYVNGTMKEVKAGGITWARGHCIEAVAYH